MTYNKSSKLNRTTLVILMSFFLLIFNYAFKQFTLFLSARIFRVLPEPVKVFDVGMNITEHILFFVIYFVPTFTLCKRKNLDFGYHGFTKKSFIISFLVVTIAALFQTAIEKLFGVVFQPDNYIQWFVTQLFFSGLGEELIFRSVPIVLLRFAYGKDTVFIVRNKQVDFGIIITSCLFAIAHIYPLICAGSLFEYGFLNIFWTLFGTFVMGIILATIYKKSNSIWLVMISHGISNSLVGVFSILLGLI